MDGNGSGEGERPKRRRGAQPRESYELTDEQREILRGLTEPITVKRAAEILGQSESSLYNAIDAGRLRGVPYHWDQRTMWKLVGEHIIEWADSRQPGPHKSKRKP